MNIRLVVLTTGEQLLANVTEQTATHTTINKPAIIIPTGKGELGFMPWLPYTNVDTTGVVLQNTHVVCAVEPKTELANHYNSMFGNGIVVPDSSIARPELKLTN